MLTARKPGPLAATQPGSFLRHMTAAADFPTLIASLTATLVGRPLDEALAADLNRLHPPGSATFEAIAAACRAGVAAGSMCQHEGGGIRYGRVIKPSLATHDFSVDVVGMADLAGPHHSHPNGEIDLVMPLAGLDDLSPGGTATFDGQPAGWTVYGPGTAHRPTVSGGRALVLYLLPQGAIQFTRT
jgi:Domain of unknown function (DUF4863)